MVISLNRLKNQQYFYMKKEYILIFLSIIILASCTPVRYGYIEAEKPLLPLFSEITENSRFPELAENISFIENTDRQYAKALEKNNLLQISLYSAYSHDTAENNEKTITAIIRKSVHIPVTDYRNTETNAGADDVTGGKYITEEPEKISLPFKGLSYEGKYPDSSSYSLYRETRIKVSLPDKLPEKAKTALMNWIDEIRIKENTVNDTSEEITWIGAVGDIMPGRGVQDILINNENGREIIFSDTLTILRDCDLLMGNLEGPVTFHKTAIDKAYNFKFRHKVLGELKETGFDYLSAVNNHCYDFDQQGFLDTLSNLDRYSIKTSGAGKNLDEALTPACFSKGGTDYRILSLADYPAEKDKFEGRKETEAADNKPGILWPSESVFDAVKKMSAEKGVSIVSVHGGYEWQNQPALKQKRLYRKLIDLGADIVIGSHPHVLQPVESWKGSLIVYSLGNFVFPGMDETEYGEESMILHLGFRSSKLLYINYIPVNIDGKFLSTDKSGNILKRFSELNSSFSD